MSERVKTVYVLLCPDTYEIRYVGATILSLKKRLNCHIGCSQLVNRNSPKDVWIRSLTSQDKLPIIQAIEIVLDDYQEAHWIAHYTALGCQLLNVSALGTGYDKSPETRNKISSTLQGRVPWNKGKVTSEETKQKLREKMTGRVYDDDFRQKVSAGLKGKTFSAERCQRMSEARKGQPSTFKGKKHTDESRQRMSEGSKGILHSEATKLKIGKGVRRYHSTRCQQRSDI